MTTPIQWFPGHIAKARRQLQEQLKNVDLVFVVLDSRIPQSCYSSDLDELIGTRERIVVLNRTDMVPTNLLRQWQHHIEVQFPVVTTNAQSGDGVRDALRASQSAYQRVNQRRKQRGMLPRAVRAAVIGFPNVGKSALINRLVGKRAVRSSAKPGVTRQLQWVRVAPEIELLDSPGILPMRLNDQQGAMKLAICDDIGTLSYQIDQVAQYCFDLLLPLIPEQLEARYHFDPRPFNGESWLVELANLKHQGLTLKAGAQLLHDFRKGYLGPVMLEPVASILTQQPSEVP